MVGRRYVCLSVCLYNLQQSYHTQQICCANMFFLISAVQIIFF